MNETKPDRFTGILAGWDGLIREHYRLRHAITTKTAAREAYQKDPDLLPLFLALFERTEQKPEPNP